MDPGLENLFAEPAETLIVRAQAQQLGGRYCRKCFERHCRTRRVPVNALVSSNTASSRIVGNSEVGLKWAWRRLVAISRSRLLVRNTLRSARAASSSHFRPPFRTRAWQDIGYGERESGSSSGVGRRPAVRHAE